MDAAGGLSDEIRRRRLIDRLDIRWRTPVTVVRAPAGFGKTVALDQARRANLASPAGVDVPIRCTSTDDDARLLLGHLSDALGRVLPGQVGPTRRPRSGRPASEVVSAMADVAPTAVCLIVDDVHHLTETGTGARLLDEIASTLPSNGHLVVSGRSVPLPLGALPDPPVVGRDELAFDHSETAVLAARHEIEPEALGVPSDWPALVQLSLDPGTSSPLDFIVEEVLGDLDDRHRSNLVVITAAGTGGADPEVLADVLGVEALAPAQLAAVPLVTTTADGTARAHRLWHEAHDHLADADRRSALVDATRRSIDRHGGQPSCEPARSSTRRDPTPGGPQRRPPDTDLLVLRVCGTMRLSESDRVPTHPLLRRRRVREVLGLLVLRSRVHVETVEELVWADLAPERRRANLRTTLTYVRRALEPASAPGGAPLIRRHEDRLVLHRGDQLVVDLWELQDALSHARSERRAGRSDAALTASRRAVDTWTGEVLPDLRHFPGMLADLRAIDHSLSEAGATVARDHLSAGRTGEAVTLAHRLIDLDPLDERAYSTAVEAHLRAGELHRAAVVARRCVDALARIGARPEPATATTLRRALGDAA